jgi:response regulator RpfG family c-di-GMP phosphodiesterase
VSFHKSRTTLDQDEHFPVFLAVVDDETDLTYLFKDALSQIPNVRVFGFSDPILALEHFRLNNKNYRCIISDYRMPELNGVQLLNKMKEINPQVARILMSAFEVEDGLLENYNCVDKFLQKPITMTDLLEEVKKHMGAIEVKESTPSLEK